MLFDMKLIALGYVLTVKNIITKLKFIRSIEIDIDLRLKGCRG